MSSELIIALIGVVSSIVSAIIGAIFGGIVTFLVTEYSYQRKKREENRKIVLEWANSRRSASLRGLNLKGMNLKCTWERRMRNRELILATLT